MNATTTNVPENKNQSESTPYLMLIFGIIFIIFGFIGAIVVYNDTDKPEDDKKQVVVSCIVLMVIGIGMVVAHVLKHKKKTQTPK